MGRHDTPALIEAVQVAHDSVIEAQKWALLAGNSEALEALSIAREWLRLTLRRLGMER
jgi:hypothetical protein